VTLFPCNECAKAVIQSGIKTVIYEDDKYRNAPNNIASARLLHAAGVRCVRYQRTGRRIEIEL
jgi:dCMP deaminase